jgi:hypothetical protein
MDTTNIKFIRCLWGDFDEIIPEPILDEVVYVWGQENQDKLVSRGFECVLVSEEKIQYPNHLDKFKHKLDALKYGVNDFGRVIFLDWDVTMVKPIDDKFYTYFYGKEFMMPTYSYPVEYMDMSDFYYDLIANEWVKSQIFDMNMFGWKMDNNIILPNAGFIYCDGIDVINKLINITDKWELKTLIEEFAAFIYSNSSLDDYILNYEPTVIFGREEDHLFHFGPIMKLPQVPLHEKINGLIKKDIYFIHE